MLLALVALLVLGQPPQGVHASGSTSAESHATLNALLYLHTQQSAADGSVAGSVAETAEFVVAAAIDGYDPNTLGNGGPTAVQYLAGQVAKASSGAGDAGWLIQAAVAAGADPTNFGGVNVITALNSLYDSTTGEYNDGSFNGVANNGDAFGQSLAILALETAQLPVPSNALDYLRNHQNSDGGWDYPVNDKDAFGSDSNSTAMVLMALDGANKHGHDAKALSFLATVQQPDGGFAYQSGSPTDPDSDALVAQALIAAEQDPTSAKWTQGGNTVISNLLALQTASGGFAGFNGVDALTTAQVPPALEGVAFPVNFIGHSYYAKGSQLPSSLPTPTPVITGSLAPPISTAVSTPTAQVPAVHAAAFRGVATAGPTPSSTPTAATPTPSPTSAVLGTSATKQPGAPATASTKSSSNWWIYLLAVLFGLAVAATATLFFTRSKTA